MKVLWLTNIPSPYRVKFFSELGKKIELTVLFEKAYSNERDNTWKRFSFDNFNGIVLKGISVFTDMAFSVGFQRYIKTHKNDIIVVSNPITPTGIRAILFMQMHRIRYCIESDGAFPQTNCGIKGKLKTLLYKHAECCFTTSELGKQYFANYGVKLERIKKYPFSSVSKGEIVDYSDIFIKKQEIKEELGICEEKIILSVGRFIPGKGFENLILAANSLPDNVGIYIIGGVPTDSYISIVNENKKERMHFLKFMPSEELKKYYLCADVFVFPTHKDIWGLVVNEAMASGLPVITTDRCISGLEMISDNGNGYIVKDNDINNLESRMREILFSKKYKQMSLMALERAKEYTIDSMVEAHVSYFEKMR